MLLATLVITALLCVGVQLGFRGLSAFDDDGILIQMTAVVAVVLYCLC